MRVLFLSSMRQQDKNAYCHRLLELAKTLTKHNIETDILYLRDCYFSRPLLIQPFNLPFLYSKIQRWDFIHAGEDAAYVASLWKPFTSAKIIYDCHGDTVNEAKLNWEIRGRVRDRFHILQAKIMTKIANRGADNYLVVSKPMLKHFLSKGISERKILLLRNGVDTNLFQPYPENENKNFEVCYAGGFDNWQGIDNLISAIKLLKDDAIRFKIIGFEPNHAQLKQKIYHEIGDKVVLLDRMSQQLLIEHLSRANVLIIPRNKHAAIEVAFPTKFAEYLALGKPIIVTDVDETACLVRKYQCGLVSEPNPKRIALTISEMKNMRRVDRERLGFNSRTLATSTFNWEIIGDIYAKQLHSWSCES